jgi:uroporphyrinogen-III decarboxylase
MAEIQYGTKEWSQLTWQEKREQRFNKWLEAPGIKFIDKEAEKLYKERVTRFIKAIKMEEPDRVPVMLPTGYYPAYYAGYDYRTMMYDYDAMSKAWTKFMDDFGDMDTYGPHMSTSGKIAEASQSRVRKYPGIGLPDNSSMNQISEGEYMMADEYDQMMMDPTDYHLRVTLPRTVGLFESFRKLPRMRSIQEEGWVRALSDPDNRRTFQTLMDLGDEQKRLNAVVGDLSSKILSRGYPSFRGQGVMAGAPFDHLADLMRGTRGMSLDMFRQPKKVHEAMEHELKMTLAAIKNVPPAGSPVCFIALHKGDDAFMSDKQFDEFYWPYFRKIMLAMVEDGLVPMPFAEGRYTNRLKQITDTPKSSVIWWFDHTDMALAKKILGNVSCIVGNVPTSVVKTATAAEVRENCRKLIETCAPGGGYILAGGASIDKGKFENLKVMMEAAYEYGKY